MRMAQLCNQYNPHKEFSSARLVDSHSLVGVEIELEHGEVITSKESAKIKAYFEIADDDSLRNNGVELRFKRPYSGKRVERALKIVGNLEGRVSLGERTSVHVHLDVRSIPINVFSRMIALYLLFEPVFFQVGGEHRRNSIYCWPLGKTEGLVYYIAKDLAHRECMDYRRFKYSALNVGSMYKFGSVEFRHHEGCVNTTRLLNWINMILNLKKLAYQSRAKRDISTVLDLFSVADLLKGTTIVLPKKVDLIASREVAEEFIYTYKYMCKETSTVIKTSTPTMAVDGFAEEERTTFNSGILQVTSTTAAQRIQQLNARQRELINSMSRTNLESADGTWWQRTPTTPPVPAPLDDDDDEEEYREPEDDDDEPRF